MYYPYFRGKQFDLLALKTLIEEERLSKKIIPIIEPVKNSSTLKKFLALTQTKKQPIFIIENPQAGDFLTEKGYAELQQLDIPKAAIIDQSLETMAVLPELLVVSESKPVLMSDWQENTSKVFVHEEFRLLQKINGELILSEDPFTRLPRTNYYSETEDEFFSNTHLTFRKKGFIGFSDFSVDSRIYYDQSYPSPIVSLHLVYFEKNDLRVHHFLSSEKLSSQKEKFMELMEAVVSFGIDKLCEGSLTLGLQLLLENQAQNKFPGMGMMRKAAVMHHMELMSRFLENDDGQEDRMTEVILC